MPWTVQVQECSSRVTRHPKATERLPSTELVRRKHFRTGGHKA